MQWPVPKQGNSMEPWHFRMSAAGFDKEGNKGVGENHGGSVLKERPTFPKEKVPYRACQCLPLGGKVGQPEAGSDEGER